MRKINLKIKNFGLYLALSLVVILAAAVTAGAKSDKSSGSQNQNQNQNQIENQNQNSEKNQNENKLLNQIKNQDKNNIQTTAQIHKAKTEIVVKNLKGVASKEKEQNQEMNREKEQIANQLEQIADQENQAEEQATDAIKKVETRNKWKTLLVGTDYKNLGQLRSELVRNRNQIRQLTRLMVRVEGDESKLEIQNQVATLLEEREGIYNLVKQSEDKFSILGWIFRFLSGYPSESVDQQQQEEEQLKDEIGQALEEIENQEDSNDQSEEPEEQPEENSTSGTLPPTDSTAASQ